MKNRKKPNARAGSYSTNGGDRPISIQHENQKQKQLDKAIAENTIQELQQRIKILEEENAKLKIENDE